MSVRRFVLPVLPALSLIMLGCEPESHRPERVEADVRFLSNDLLEGRLTPSRGLDVAALYLANQLDAAGWEPGNDGSYIQTYEVGVFDPAAAEYAISINGIALAENEYLFLSLGLLPEQTPVEYELVNAGYGVSVPEEGADDFRGLDVAGKAVVSFLGAPWELDPGVIHAPDHGIGKAVQVAVRNGALLVYVTEELSDPPPEAPSAELGLLSAYSGLSLTQLIEDPRTSAISIPILAIGPEVFDRTLGRAAGGSYAAIQERLVSGESVAGGLAATVRIEVETETKRGSAANVIGILPGTDPALRDEWLLLTAHFDHVGTFPAPPGEDGINNGADDNASGTAAVLEVARRLAEENGLKRSVMVAFFSGEEMGLVGSAYYALHPLAPLDQTVVDINVDMVGRSDGTVQALSPGSDELFQKAAEIGEAAGLTVLPDQQPGWRLNYFLDSYQFARHAIPLVSVFTALHEDYHQPSDEVDKIRFAELNQIVDMLTHLAEHYAGGAVKPSYQRPAWFLTPG